MLPPSASDIKDYFSTAADVSKSVAGDITSLRDTFSFAGYKVPRKDAQAIAVVAPGGEFEKNRAAAAAASATGQALKTGGMDFRSLFSGPSSSLVSLAIMAIVALVIWKAVK